LSRDLVRSASRTCGCGSPGRTPGSVSGLLRSPSRASCAPTASGQNQKPERTRSVSAEGVGACADPLLPKAWERGLSLGRNRTICCAAPVKPADAVYLTHRCRLIQDCCAAHREQAALPRPPARIKSLSVPGLLLSSARIKSLSVPGLFLPKAWERGLSLGRNRTIWCAAPAKPADAVYLTHRCRLIQDCCAAHREQAALPRPPARIKSLSVPGLFLPKAWERAPICFSRRRGSVACLWAAIGRSVAQRQ
jgi:hypothetical protein